jgi:hypothetical protein
MLTVAQVQIQESTKWLAREAPTDEFYVCVY